MALLAGNKRALLDNGRAALGLWSQEELHLTHGPCCIWNPSSKGFSRYKQFLHICGSSWASEIPLGVFLAKALQLRKHIVMISLMVMGIYWAALQADAKALHQPSGITGLLNSRHFCCS